MLKNWFGINLGDILRVPAPLPPHPFENLNKQGWGAGQAVRASEPPRPPPPTPIWGDPDWVGMERIQGAPSLRLGQPPQHSRPPAQGWGRPGRDFITYVFRITRLRWTRGPSPQFCKAQERYSKMGGIAKMGLLVT